MNKFSFLVAACAGLALSPSIAPAALVVNVGASGTEAGGGDPLAFSGDVLGNDLVNAGQATLAGATSSGYVPVNGTVGQPQVVLNDGIHGGTAPGGLAARDSTGVFELIYDLNVGAPNGLGYDLTSIRSFASFAGNRTAQEYTVSVDLVGGGVNFVSLGSFNSLNPTQGDLATFLVLENDVNPGVAAFATGVESIRFEFVLPPVPAGDGIARAPSLREIDILGVATIPEPSSVCLMALGMVGIAARRRRGQSK